MFLFTPLSFLVSKVKNVVKTFDPIRKADKMLFVERTKDLNEGLYYSDFSLRSLMDAEAIDFLQPFSPLSVSRLSSLDSSSAAVSALTGLVANLPEPSSVDVSSKNVESLNN